MVKITDGSKKFCCLLIQGRSDKWWSLIHSLTTIIASVRFKHNFNSRSDQSKIATVSYCISLCQHSCTFDTQFHPEEGGSKSLRNDHIYTRCYVHVQKTALSMRSDRRKNTLNLTIRRKALTLAT
jgi:hypothetical protein